MKKGFTLVELSIVIVIIGFLVAGISAGSQLVEQAKLRTFITDIEGWKSDYDEFKYIYNAVPGDFYNASAYWSNCAVGGAGNINCNGNGNGIIEFDTFSPYPGVDIGGEVLRVFRHFNLSGINVS